MIYIKYLFWVDFDSYCIKKINYYVIIWIVNLLDKEFFRMLFLFD